MTGRDGSLSSVKGLSVKVRFLLAVISFTLFAGCATRPTKSLCFLDFYDQICWVDKEKDIGFSFAEMWEQQKRCVVHDQIPCWYSLDSSDLMRIRDSL